MIFLRITALLEWLSGFTSTSLQTRNKKFNTARGAAESSVKFRVLVCKRELVNPENTRTKSAVNVLIFSLNKPLKYMHFNYRVIIVKLY